MRDERRAKHFATETMSDGTGAIAKTCEFRLIEAILDGSICRYEHLKTHDISVDF